MNPSALSPERQTAADVVRLLDLAPLPDEGGWFRRTAEAEAIVGPEGRRASSTIFFLVTPEGFSALHRLDATETWCFHAGDPLTMLLLGADGTVRRVVLGDDLAAGQSLQVQVAADCWQGARLVAGGRWSLASCVVAPEFRAAGFELGQRAALCAAFPAQAAEIAALTR